MNSREVCVVTGLTYRQLDYWTRRGVLVSDGGVQPGSGIPRQYGELEVRVATVCSALGQLGAPLDTLRELARQLRDLDGDRWGDVVHVDRFGNIGPAASILCWTLDLDALVPRAELAA